MVEWALKSVIYLSIYPFYMLKFMCVCVWGGVGGLQENVYLHMYSLTE